MARPTPLDRVRASLRDALAPEELARVPRGYFRVGDVLVLDLPLPGDEALVAQAFARELRMRSVLGRAGRVSGEFRRPTMRHLWGDPETTTVHTEVGVKYRIDPARVMWSPGNLAERQRLAALRVPGATVVDLFAGVGYLSLPLAVHGGAARVVAIEKAPATYGFLRENAALNGVAQRYETVLGDCRDVAPTGVADRVLLGLLPDSIGFLPTALAALRRPGCILDVHRAVPADGLARSAREVLARVPGGALLATHRVKSYGPGKDHVVHEVRVGP